MRENYEYVQMYNLNRISICFASMQGSSESSQATQAKKQLVAVSGRIVWAFDRASAYNAKSSIPTNPKVELYDAQGNSIACSFFAIKRMPLIESKSLASIKNALSQQVDTTKLTSITDYTDGSWKSYFGFKKITK